MRLAIAPELSTKDGVTNANARLTNVVVESTPRGDKLALIRPGLRTQGSYTGSGNGLTSFNDQLVSIFGADLVTVREDLPYVAYGEITDIDNTGLGNSYGTAAASGADTEGFSDAVIVGDAIFTTYLHAFRWDAIEEMTDLGTLGGNESQATAVSANGAYVFGYSHRTGSGDYAAFRWFNLTGMVDIGPSAGVGDDSYAYDCSDDGEVAIGTFTNLSAQTHAFRWVAGSGFTDLGTAGGGTSSYAVKCSADGSVVIGRYTDGSGYLKAFRWTQAGGMVGLGTLGGDNSYATLVTPDGATVFGFAQDGGGTYYAFKWTSGAGMVSIGIVQELNGISDDGNVACGKASNHPFRWTPSAGLVDLGTFGGASGTASRITGDGTVIIGRASDGASTYTYYWNSSEGKVSLGTGTSDLFMSPTGLVITGILSGSFGTHAFVLGGNRIHGRTTLAETLANQQFDFAQSTL